MDYGTIIGEEEREEEGWRKEREEGGKREGGGGKSRGREEGKVEEGRKHTHVRERKVGRWRIKISIILLIDPTHAINSVFSSI